MAHNSIHPRPTYTQEQVEEYFDTIKFPAKYRASAIVQTQDVSSVDPVEALAFLTALIRYQIAGVPWENLELHYSSHHTISVDPLHVFHKIVERNDGRGGYCMENALLLATVLRSLGFDVMPIGARVNTAIQPISQSSLWKGPNFEGWYHMLLIVRLDGKKYLVDVGLGNYSPTFPVPLEDGYTAINIPPSQEIRLKREFIPDNSHATDAEQKLWVYSLRFNEEAPWLPGYCFNETEFLPQDFEMMNFFVSKSPKTWFAHHVVCLRFLMDKETEDIIGHVTLFDRGIQERVRGVGKKIATVSSEQERIDALQQHLGVTLSGPERSGIEGLVSMIV